MVARAAHPLMRILILLLLWPIDAKRAEESSSGEPISDDLQLIQSRVATSSREHNIFDELSKNEETPPAAASAELLSDASEAEQDASDAARDSVVREYEEAQKAAEAARKKAREAYEALERAEMKMIKANLEKQTGFVGNEDILQQKAALQTQHKLGSDTLIVPGVAKTFDISINAFKRDKFLDYSLKNYLSCHPDNYQPTHGADGSSLSHIFVIWNDNNRTIPDFLKEHEKTGLVTFYTTSGEDRLSKRFTPINYTSDAVFHVDDDQPHMCNTLFDMFAIWQTDPDGMVGSSPRKKDLMDPGLDCWACPLIWGEYNIVFLTKGAFVHKRFFEEYMKPLWKPIRDVVDDFNCGEDFLMSAVHASVVGSGKVYAIAGSVNKGDWMVKESRHLTKELKMVEEYTGLNVRTWEVRGKVTEHIKDFLVEHFPEEAKQGHFSKMTKQWWRSNLNPGQSCREQTIPCYNRAWDSCSVECDVQVRGSMACFTGDSACYSGVHLGTPMDWGEQDQIVCVGETCSF
mmetsp:Transcript_29075/g.54446  ORF Transcript_29075/g.54446 Transcript_29075/m.54446 type:complete len:517 (-) Transcript_29075:49-1599(-)